MSTPIIDLGWTLGAIAESVKGTVVGDRGIRVTSVTSDSRNVAHGALFVAIEGERFDGHHFATAAVDAGAAAALVDVARRSEAVPRIEVTNTLAALKQLGVMRREELDVPVVAITGSTGKTSTKDLVAAGIPGSWASPRSYNNEIGVPLTVLSTPDDASAVILEVGSRGVGHIAWLAPIVQPDIAVVTNLGVVHLETFGSEAGLADAKHELIEALGPDGIAIIPSDEPRLDRGIASRVVTFGRAPADVVVVAADVGHDGSAEFEIETDESVYSGTLAMAGTHQAYNAAAAIAVAATLGMEIGPFVHRIQKTAGSAWRMDVHQGTYTVVNDAYNANPQSVAAALRTVAAMPGRSFAVLGPMAELGPVCEQQHRDIGELAEDLGFESIIVVGPDHGYGLGAPDIVVHAANIDAVPDTLSAILAEGDVVLVKASRSAGLERLALTLIKEAQK